MMHTSPATLRSSKIAAICFAMAICTLMQAALLGAQTPVGRIVGGGPVTNVGSNLCLDVVRASAEDGLNVQLGQCRNGTAAWDLIDLGGGEYALLNRTTKRVLDVAGGAFNDGANVQQYAWNNSGAQRWRLESTAKVGSRSKCRSGGHIG